MVDASDVGRIDQAKNELDSLLEMPELQQTPFVIFGNKVDKRDSLTEDLLRERLGLSYHQTYGKDASHKNAGARPVEIFMCSVLKRAGYGDGFQWLSNFIK